MDMTESKEPAAQERLDRTELLQQFHHALVRELSNRQRAAEPATDDQELGKAANTREGASVGEALLFLLLAEGADRLIAWISWGGIDSQPGWYDVLTAVLTIACVLNVVEAVKKRSTRG